MNKEKWVEDILQSAKEIKPVASNPFMTTRIEAKLQQPSPVKQLSLRWVYISATAMVMLVFINIKAWQQSSPSPSSNGVQQLLQEYGWNNSDIYSVTSSKPSHE